MYFNTSFRESMLHNILLLSLQFVRYSLSIAVDEFGRVSVSVILFPVKNLILPPPIICLVSKKVKCLTLI